MRKLATLITGAVGEIGQALIHRLVEEGASRLITLDLKPLSGPPLEAVTHVQGDILDSGLLSRLITEYEFETVYHLAAILSTRAEFSPEMAHRINVDGTLNLLQLAADQTAQRGKPVRFIFPSSIAAYGLPDLATKEQEGKVKEWEWNYPTTMYGCNKLYCELLGTYFSRHYLQMAEIAPDRVDFRCVRFPGLISAFTVPSGGTSDYAPEMLHSAARNHAYTCFVREDTRIPFMAMPDAVRSLLRLAKASSGQVTRRVYNVTSFTLSAMEVKDLVQEAFESAEINFEPDERRQGIVDSWPSDLDDSAARADWGWHPEFDVTRAFNEYLVPNIRKRYLETTY